LPAAAFHINVSKGARAPCW